VSDLTFIEKSKLEKLFGMTTGYVLSFSNRTFQEFIIDAARRDIYGGQYDYGSNSKANLLRRFWEVEPNHTVGKVLSDLIELAKECSISRDDESLVNTCRRIAERLRQGAPVEELQAITEELTEKGFDVLIRPIRASIDDNEPEGALDRLHTLVTRFLRCLCESHAIPVTKEKPLHSLFGEYIKRMKASGAIETQMTERILKSSIANLEAFNSVRNDHSLAHDNPILNYEESLLIFNNVVSAIRFIQALERREATKDERREDADNDDVPF
jgi:hypothetical protein